MNKLNKTKCQRAHAKRRANQRYGLSLNRDKLNAMVRLIQEGKCTFIERQSNRVTVFSLLFEGLTFPVVYDKQRKTIVTVLPPEALEGTKRGIPSHQQPVQRPEDPPLP